MTWARHLVHLEVRRLPKTVEAVEQPGFREIWEDWIERCTIGREVVGEGCQ